MNKSTKGALAASAAGALLLGGAGSLAYWNATATVAGTTVNSGSLTLTPLSPCTNFALDTPGPASAPQNQARVSTLVPGDTLTKTCTFTVGATGNHLVANLSTTGSDSTGTLADFVKVESSYSVGSTAQATQITSADNGKTLTATIKVTFPEGGDVDNASQLKQLNLSSFVVTATQVHG